MSGLGLQSSAKGRWHVIYGLGQRSEGMTLSVALDYKRIFNAPRIEAKFFGIIIGFGD